MLPVAAAVAKITGTGIAGRLVLQKVDLGRVASQGNGNNPKILEVTAGGNRCMGNIQYPALASI